MHLRCTLILVAVILSACGIAGPMPEASAKAASGQPAVSRCPGLDITLAELIALGRPAGRECFGDGELTLRGWVWEDQGAYDCVHYVAPGDPVPPDWLYCTMNHARLTAVAYPPGEPMPGFIHPADGPFLVAVDPATPAANVLQPNQWVEVVGRFDDPATEQCELVGDPSFRDECLSAFVVREARAIDAP